jgi:uncharacterized membrane protein
MSANAIAWLRVFHLFGVMTWVGTMMSLFYILDAHARAEMGARPAFHQLERVSAIAMDIGATIAIACGVILLVQEPFLLKGHGFMHAKLALVAVVFLGGHGFLRVKVRKFRESHFKPLPPGLPQLVSLALLGILVLVLVKPF